MQLNQRHCLHINLYFSSPCGGFACHPQVEVLSSGTSESAETLLSPCFKVTAPDTFSTRGPTLTFLPRLFHLFFQTPGACQSSLAVSFWCYHQQGLPYLSRVLSSALSTTSTSGLLARSCFVNQQLAASTAGAALWSVRTLSPLDISGQSSGPSNNDDVIQVIQHPLKGVIHCVKTLLSPSSHVGNNSPFCCICVKYWIGEEWLFQLDDGPTQWIAYQNHNTQIQRF